MKKKIMMMLSLALVSAMLLAGCASTATETETQTEEQAETETQTEEQAEETETEETEEAEQTEELANPWTESDEQGVADATGFDMTAPEGATDVSYSYMSEEAMAQMTYTLDGASWTYRLQMGDEMEDISGMSYAWMTGTEDTVGNWKAMYYAYNAASNDGTETVELMNWYDMVTGVNYSLSATGKELSQEEMKTYAESIYAPLQGEATDDAFADREAELNNYFLGEHKRSDDESYLTISENSDGTFKVDILITRLANLENGTGTFEDHKMNFVVKDPNDNDLSGMIYLDSDNSLCVKITDSTWDLLPNDEVLTGFGK